MPAEADCASTYRAPGANRETGVRDVEDEEEAEEECHCDDVRYVYRAQNIAEPPPSWHQGMLVVCGPVAASLTLIS